MITLQLTENEVQNLLNCLNEARKCHDYQHARMSIAFMDKINAEVQKAQVSPKPNGAAAVSTARDVARLGLQAPT